MAIGATINGFTLMSLYIVCTYLKVWWMRLHILDTHILAKLTRYVIKNAKATRKQLILIFGWVVQPMTD
jgi:hypothetical protein